MVASPCRFTVSDLKVLQEVLAEKMAVIGQGVGTSYLRSVHSALDIIIKRGAVNHARKFICIDDCNLVPPGHNGNLYDLPVNELWRHYPESSYLGKALIEWRLKIQK